MAKLLVGGTLCCPLCQTALYLTTVKGVNVAVHGDSEYLKCDNKGKRYEVPSIECKEIVSSEDKNAGEYLKDATAL